MAHFYGEIRGNRGDATRMGSKDSGMFCHVRGWNFGVRVDMYVNEEGEDAALIQLSPGSNGNGVFKTIGKFTRKDLKD